MPVRDATVDDLEVIHELINDLAAYEQLSGHAVSTIDDLRRHLFGTDPAASVLIAEDTQGEVAGFALYFRTFSTFVGRPGIWLEDLYVRPSHRGQGLGRELLHQVSQRTEGRFEWSALDWNESAMNFYRHLGAVPLDGWTIYRWVPSE